MNIISKLRVDLNENIAKALSELNKEQREAVLSTDQPLLVLAPAGTGKTHVLAARYMLLRSRGIRPNAILAVTFTRRAADQMKERIAPSTIGYTDKDLYVDTFHGICLRILKTIATNFGLRPGFRIADEDEQHLLMREAVSQHDPESLGNPEHSAYHIQDLLGLLDSIKTAGCSLFQITPGVHAVRGRMIDETTHLILLTYEQLMREENKVDFNDLILMPYSYLKTKPDEARRWSSSFKAVLVDEYQDTNPLQYQMLRMLAADTQSVLLLGDDDQVLYTWRGADIGLIMDFEKQWPNGKVTTLVQNYRNAPEILHKAKVLIAHNQERRRKTMKAVKDKTCRVEHHTFENHHDEIHHIRRTIEQQIASGTEPGQIAVLTRTKARAAELSLTLSAQGIRCWYPDNHLIETREAKAILNWARIYLNENDNLAVRNSMRWPQQGFTELAIMDLARQARETQRPIITICREILARDPGATASPIGRYLATVDEVRKLNLDDDRIFRHIATTTGIATSCESSSSMRPETLEDILNLFQAIRDSNGSLQETLESISLGITTALEVAHGQQAVRIDTMHSSKGLEYECVIAPGWEEGEFPRARHDEKELAEERRIAYVTITRARTAFIATSVRSRPGKPKLFPSRFLKELGMTTDFSY